MEIKILNEQHFQVLSTNFTIGASNEGYTLMFSADGDSFSPLFSVDAGVERMVTSVANGAYYYLAGNATELTVNWQRECHSGGGGGGGEYVLPTASADTLGGVKIGSGISVAADGTISVNGGGGAEIVMLSALSDEQILAERAYILDCFHNNIPIGKTYKWIENDFEYTSTSVENYSNGYEIRFNSIYAFSGDENSIKVYHIEESGNHYISDLSFHTGGGSSLPSIYSIDLDNPSDNARDIIQEMWNRTVNGDKNFYVNIVYDYHSFNKFYPLNCNADDGFQLNLGGIAIYADDDEQYLYASQDYNNSHIFTIRMDFDGNPPTGGHSLRRWDLSILNGGISAALDEIIG